MVVDVNHCRTTSTVVLAGLFWGCFFGGRCELYAVKADNLRLNTSHQAGPFFPAPSDETRAQPADQSAGYANEADGQKALAQLISDESACQAATQSIIVIDGGSTGTRPYLFTVQTESCPGVGRAPRYETLKFVAEGQKIDMLRMVIQEWLRCAAGEDWSVQASTSKLMFKYLPQLQLRAAELVTRLLKDAIRLVEENLTKADQEHAALLGIPVIFHSTGGVRDLPSWYLSAYFVAFRHCINRGKHHEVYRVFTDPNLTRPLSGEEEGIYTFLTANFLTGRLAQLKEVIGEEGGRPRQSLDLAGIVEVGGASVQVVLPVNPLEPFPSFIKLVDLHPSPFFSGIMPHPKILSVSLMQLGASSSAAVLLKKICSKDKYLSNRVCMHPCFPRGYRQQCSLGPMKVTADGQVQVDDSPTASRLNSAANFCSLGNEHVGSKQTVQQWCMYHLLDPSKRLTDKLKIPDCTIVEGAGDFDNCLSEVESTLMRPPMPLPANMEAVAGGFENFAQIFRYTDSATTVYICGAALVSAIETLKMYGLLPQSWDGRNVAQLVTAARDFCKISVGVDRKDGLVFHMPTSRERKPYRVGAYTFDLCAKLAQAVSTVSYLLASERSPRPVIFQNHIDGAELTWHYGAILDRIMRKSYWARTAYELGASHNYATPALKKL